MGAAALVVAVVAIDGAPAQSLPTLSVDDVTVVEPNAGTRAADFTVTLSSPSTRQVTVDFTSADGSAVAPDDYTAINRPIVFEPGQTAKVVTVPVVGDTFIEGNETFVVNLSRPARAVVADGIGAGTIVDNDPSARRGSTPITASPQARLTLTKTSSPDPPIVGQPLTYTLTVKNEGPATATGVTVVDVIPPNVRFESTSPQGACTVVGHSITCGEPSFVGCGPPTCSPSTGLTLAVGQSAVFKIVVTPLKAVDIYNRAGVSADQAAAIGVGGVLVNHIDRTLHAPVAGRSVVVLVVSGKVYIKVVPPIRKGAQAAKIHPGPNTKRFVRLKKGANIAIGSTVDVEEGRVALLAASNLASTRVQRAEFFGGVFGVHQKRVAQPVAEAALVTGSYASQCGTPTASAGRASAARSKKRLGHLYGNGKGRFRTKGRFAAATVRGTIWLTEDRCDGTLTRVVKGKVAVFDSVRRTRVTVTKNHSYLARATRAAIKRLGKNG
jgi:uncharacterized repeat protein (TIGR01451 family)